MKLKLFLGCLALTAAHAGATVHRWGVCELVFESGRDWSDPVQEVTLEVEFAGPGGRVRRRPGFWDGGRTWRVRFAPSTPGDWNWRSICKQDRSLDGKKGSFTCSKYKGDNPLYRRGPIRISADKWHFVHADGTPWFWLADTAWNGPLLAQANDWRLYLQDRRKKGFSAVQFIATQWRGAYRDAAGQVAYKGRRRIAVSPGFFQRMEERIKAIVKAGLVPVPVMFWAVGGPRINPGEALPEDQLVILGKYMTARWGAYPCVWLLGGDGNYLGKRAEKWKRIGRAIFRDRPDLVVSIHPGGRTWPCEEFRREPWFDFIGYQSGHDDSDASLRWLVQGPPARFWRNEPHCPVVNLEPNYEGIVGYTKRRVFGDREVRRACYWSLLVVPTAGVTYGAQGVWSWQEKAGAPLNHSSTGIARPWREAMNLPGSGQMKHLAGFFRSVEWWKLRPAEDLVEAAREGSVRVKTTHLVYVRSKDGRARLFLDGLRRANGSVPGDFSNWDGKMPLVLANEFTKDRPWLGVLYRVAIYDRALSGKEIREHFRKGRKASLSGALALYDFGKSRGAMIEDKSGIGKPLNLRITDPQAVKWTADGGLRIKKAVSILSRGPAAKIIEACRKSNEISIEAWIRPADTRQAGPARIVSISSDPARRNLTLGQDGDAYIMRLRTTRTSKNGLPPLSSPGGSVSVRRFVAAARAWDGSFAVIYIPAGGEVRVNWKSIPSLRSARWFDPRTGGTREIRLGRGERRILVTPDGQDWILLLRR